MKARSICISTISILAVALGACDSKKESKAPPETRESLLNLKALPLSGSCPQIKGTYTCRAENGDEDWSIVVSKNENKRSHLLFGPDRSLTPIEYLIESFALDEGGFFVDGQVHDKAAPIRSALKNIDQFVGDQMDPKTLESLGFDKNKGDFKIDIDSIKAGYVSSCRDGEVILHYIIGQNGYKIGIKKSSQGDLALHGYAVEGKGPVVERRGECRFKSEEVRERSNLAKLATEVAADGVQNLKDSILGSELVKTWSNDSSVYVEIDSDVGHSFRNSYGENIVMKFDRRGFLSSRDIYVFAKAYWGFEDNWFGDDVTVSIGDEKQIFFKTSSKKVFLGSVDHPSDAIEIGELVQGKVQASQLILNLNDAGIKLIKVDAI